MKSRTIARILRQKINDWLKTIKDESLRKDVKKNCIVTGGAIASMLLDEDVNDYDVYLTNKDTTRRLAEYYVGKFLNGNHDLVVVETTDRVRIVVPSEGVTSTFPSPPAAATNFRVLNNKGTHQETYTPACITSNAITLTDDIQIVIRFYGTPEEIHENYDFVHCMNYWRSDTDELHLRKDALESLLTKELMYRGSLYPLASVIRTRKFIARGFTCNAGQYLKMCMQISELDLTDFKVLEEQLVGVDVTYFMQLIDTLKSAAKEGRDVDNTYIAQLVDEIFG